MSRRNALYLIAALSTIPILMSQTSINSSLRGVITDPQGLAVSGARVVLVNVDTNDTARLVTGESGHYTFARLSPGHYRLTAEREGFHQAVKEGIVLSVNEAALADIPLQVGQAAESVTVAAGAEVVQTQSAEVSSLMERQRIEKLPLNGRNFSRLMLLAPGAGGVTLNSNSATSGARVGANTYTVDGSGSNEERLTQGFSLGSGTGGSVTDLGTNVPNVISTEALQEFRILTSNADATFGRSSGAQVNMITKSGTNHLHGSAYEYLRNNKFDARDFFNTGPFLDSKGNALVPPFKQNLFGATLGGPIRKNKHFVFVNYEALRQRLSQSATAISPNAALISLMPGDLQKLYRAFYINRGLSPETGNPPGAFTPLSAANRAALLNAGFDPALTGQAGSSLISTSPNHDINQDSFLARTDHRLTKRVSAFARYAFSQSDTIATNTGLPVDFNEGVRRYQSAVAGVIWTLSPNQIVEVRAGLLRSRFFQGPLGGFDKRLSGVGVSQQAGLFLNPAGSGLAGITVYGDRGYFDAQTVPQQSLLHTWTRGRMTLRSGLDFRQLFININNGQGAPNYTFTGLLGPNGILGTAPGQPYAVAQSVAATIFGTNGGPTSPTRGYRSSHYEFFTQADWRLRRDLTLNAGLRYSEFAPYSERNNALINLYATDSSGNIQPDLSPFANGRANNILAVVGPERAFYKPDHVNYQPRLGLAWDIQGKGRTVVRAGYGGYADRITQGYFTSVVGNYPYTAQSTLSGVPFRLDTPFPVNAAIPTVFGVDPNLRNPYTHRFNVAVEERIDAGTTVTASYVGSRAVNLLYLDTPNGFGGVPQALRPDTRYSMERILLNGVSSDYNALQIFGSRRFRQGVDFTFAFTLSHLRDDYTTEAGNFPSLINLGATSAPGFDGGGSQFAPRGLHSEYGDSNFDIRRTFTMGHVVELPFGRGRRFLRSAGKLINGLAGGWSLTGFAVVHTGEPANVVLGRDATKTGDVTLGRPALLNGSLGDLEARGLSRTQFLIPQSQALTRLGAPANLADPYATVPRNALRAPGAHFYDVSLIKQFTWKERIQARLEVNAFNVFNNVNFGPPVVDLSNARFGQLTSTRTGTNPRQIQLGAKLQF